MKLAISMPDRSVPRRAVRISCWLIATALGALLFVWMRQHDVQLQRPISACIFRRVTGIACPGCGLTRALFALTRGEWGEVERLHPLAPLLALELVAIWLASGAWAAGWRVPVPRAQLERYAEKAILANAALFMIVWVARYYLHTLPW